MKRVPENRRVPRRAYGSGSAGIFCFWEIWYYRQVMARQSIISRRQTATPGAFSPVRNRRKYTDSLNAHAVRMP